MHELGITENIVAIALNHAQGAKIIRITLEIGQLTAVMPDAIRFCFDVCTQGTIAEGATLEILDIPGTGQCQQCGQSIPLTDPYGLCNCGSTDIYITHGQELAIKSLELETEPSCV
jgi:hydrogenase nickel incorporation protein HypA/HybF